MSDPAAEQHSLRAEQVAQTRAALVAAGYRLFGENGFRATSVEDLASEARVTTGALYHHFPNKTALFEAVFVQAHTDLMTASTKAAQGASDGVDELRIPPSLPATAGCSREMVPSSSQGRRGCASPTSQCRWGPAIR